jgi:Tol biopolymer transport system component
LATGQKTRIPNKGGSEAAEGAYDYEAFSRDGKQVAYDFYTKENVFQLRIRNFDGTGLRTLYSDGDKRLEIHPFDWSPDGKTILGLRDLNTETEVVLISATDGSISVLRKNASNLHSAQFSPDGRFIALSFIGESSQPQGDIYLIAADGKSEVIVAAHPSEDELLSWTPDGQGLLFLSNRSGTWDIWLAPVAEGKQKGEPVLLKKDFGNESSVKGFALDGTLYYKSGQANGSLCIGEIDFEAGKLVAPPAPVITRYAGPINFMSWSPDGHNLLYLSHLGSIGPGNNIITIRSVATGEERFLSPRLYGVNQISWAPDGRSIIGLGFGYKNADSGAYRIDAETGAVTKLAKGGVFARLCPDGKTLVQYTDDGIVKVDLATGKESLVAKGAYRFALSPDGRNIAFEVDGVWKIASLDGGAPRELYAGEKGGYFSPGMTGDGRYIIACRYGEKEASILRIPVQGGTPTKMIVPIPDLYNFTLHPEGRRFACGIRQKSKSELWVMENFLPPTKAAK